MESSNIQIATRKRVAFVTIGQTPRDDIVPELLEQVTVEVDASEFGALDGLDAEAISALKPEHGDGTLYTRLRDGTEVKVDKRRLAARLDAMLLEIDGAGFDLIVLLCTADFDGMRCFTPMIDAQIDIEPLAVGGRRLGVVLPTPEQILEIGGDGYRVDALFAHFAPHAGGDRTDELIRAADAVSSSEVVIMDCMAFNNDVRTQLQSKLKVPVVLARDLLAKKINRAIGDT